MPVVTCPSCGRPVNVPEKKTGLWWGIGCLIAGLSLPVILAILGLLAAIAIPSFVRARDTSQANACMFNLRAIEAAKNAIAATNGAAPGENVSEDQLAPYLRGGVVELKCPAGGVYSVRAIGEESECSIHGSVNHPKRPPGHHPDSLKRGLQ